MSISIKKVQKKSKPAHSVFKKQENSKSSLNKQNSSAQGILTLHQTIGNQAVKRLMKSGVIQAKLTIGQPNDKYEQEADRVADEVMRMPEAQVQRQSKEMIETKPIGEQIIPLIQRQPEAEEEELLQSKSNGKIPHMTSNLESRINALQSGGQSLSKETRNFFEPRFGQDFSKVRVHNNSNANQLARSINARAFTRGSDIVFGGGEYSPGSQGGKRLLGHELTHVVQQNQGRVQAISPMKGTSMDTIQRVIDPISAAGLGIAVFGLVSGLVPYGNGGLRWHRNIGKAIHSWPRGKEPSVSDMILDWSEPLMQIDAISGLSIAYGFWDLNWNWNGADIDQSYVRKTASSSWSGGHTGSSLNINFEMQDASASYESGGKAAMICYISGSLDPSGAGDIDFDGRVLIYADGTTRKLGSLNITRGDASDFTISSFYAGWKIKKK